MVLAYGPVSPRAGAKNPRPGTPRGSPPPFYAREARNPRFAPRFHLARPAARPEGAGGARPPANENPCPRVRKKNHLRKPAFLGKPRQSRRDAPLKRMNRAGSIPALESARGAFLELEWALRVPGAKWATHWAHIPDGPEASPQSAAAPRHRDTYGHIFQMGQKRAPPAPATKLPCKKDSDGRVRQGPRSCGPLGGSEESAPAAASPERRDPNPSESALVWTATPFLALR